MQREVCAARSCFKLDVNLGIGIGGAEFGGTPSLHDALAGNELEVLLCDVLLAGSQ